MKRYVACLAAAAVALVGFSALANAQTRHRKDHFTIVHHLAPYSSRSGAHFAGTIAAHVTAAPPGSNSGSYCTGPVVDTLYSFNFAPGPASGKVSTSVSNELLVAFVQSSGPKTGGQSVTVSGGGLTWHKVASQNTAGGDAEVWYAIAPSRISSQKITATQAKTPYAEALNIVTFKGATGIGTSGTFTASTGAPTGTIKTSHACGWVWASGNDPSAATLRGVPSGQTAWIQATLSGNVYGAPSTFWTQSTNSFTPTAGTSVTINDTSPTKDAYNLVLAEVY
jgi:hypothetical protein